LQARHPAQAGLQCVQFGHDPALLWEWGVTRSANAVVLGFKSCGCLFMLFSAFSLYASWFGRRAGIYFLAREVILEGKWIVRPATMNTPSPW
jgi:hypothetical protein